MHFHNLIESIHFDLLLEGLGILLGITLLWNILFQDSISQLFYLFFQTI